MQPGKQYITLPRHFPFLKGQNNFTLFLEPLCSKYPLTFVLVLWPACLKVLVGSSLQLLSVAGDYLCLELLNFQTYKTWKQLPSSLPPPFPSLPLLFFFPSLCTGRLNFTLLMWPIKRHSGGKNSVLGDLKFLGGELTFKAYSH